MAKTQEIKKKVIKTLKQKNKNVELDAFKPPAQSDDEDFDDNESLDSDQELQLAFARNELKPGLNVELLKPREFKNDPVLSYFLYRIILSNMAFIVTIGHNEKQAQVDSFRYGVDRAFGCYCIE